MSAPTLSPADQQVAAYLDRLRDVLPTREAPGVLAEVSSLISDRLEADGGPAATPEAVRRALEALGSPEALASSLVGGGTTIDLATRRAFTRMLAVVFAAHLLLAIVLTVIGRDATLVPGLVSALPREGLLGVLLGVVSIFLVDVGLLAVLFALFGRRRSPDILRRLQLRMPVRRRDAIGTLVLLALVAVLANVPSFRDGLFSIGGGDGRVPILAPEVVALVPAADGVLFLFALCLVLQIVAGGERVESVAVDGLASLAGAAFCVLLMTRTQLVELPTSAGLSEAQSRLFADLILRVVMIVGFVASLLLVTRFAKRCLRVRQLLAG